MNGQYHTYGNTKNTPVENNKIIQAKDAGIILVTGLHLLILSSSHFKKAITISNIFKRYEIKTDRNL